MTAMTKPDPQLGRGEFVLLEHDGRTASDAATRAAGLHWDLLVDLDGGERVATWRLDADPTGASAEILAERIGDHRRDYYEFEGAVDGGRGTVRRIDRGACRVVARSADGAVVKFTGSFLRGRWCLTEDLVARL